MSWRWGFPILEKPMPRWLQSLDRIAFILLCVYAAENCVGCAGHWLEIGPVSIRIALFMVCFAVTLPLVLYRIRDVLRNPMTWVLVAFFAWFAVSTVIGYANGNPTNFWVADITSFLPFSLYFGFVLTVRDGKRLEQLMMTIFYASVILAVVVYILHIFLAYATPQQIKDINKWMDAVLDNGLAEMKTGGQRLYLRSEIFTQVAMLIGWYELWKKPSLGKRIFLWISEAFLMAACILTYTRSLWIGLFVSVVLLFVFLYREWKRWVCSLAILGGMFAVLVGISCLCYGSWMIPLSTLERFAPSLVTESVNPTTSDPQKEAEHTGKAYEQSEVVRKDTQEEQWSLIQEKPLLGYGFGKGLTSRTDGKTEYMYQDVWMKMGIVGLVLFMLYLYAHCGVTAVRWWIGRRRHGEITAESDAARALILMSCLIGAGITSYFNPFITSPMGATIWAMALAGMEIALREPQGVLAYKTEG